MNTQCTLYHFVKSFVNCGDLRSLRFMKDFLNSPYHHKKAGPSGPAFTIYKTFYLNHGILIPRILLESIACFNHFILCNWYPVVLIASP